MKDILLRPQEPYFNHVEVDVLDYPKGTDNDPRWRCTITVDYGEYDVDQLKAQGKDLDSSLVYYRNWIYDLVRARLLDDWTATGGFNETMKIVKDHIIGFFDE